MARLDFDVKRDGPRDIPAGQYVAQIVATRIVQTQRGDGTMCVFDIEIIEGDYAGQTISHRINITNPSARCVEYGRRDLAGLCAAVGVTSVTDSDDLCGKRFLIETALDRNYPIVKSFSIAPKKSNVKQGGMWSDTSRVNNDEIPI